MEEPATSLEPESKRRTIDESESGLSGDGWLATHLVRRLREVTGLSEERALRVAREVLDLFGSDLDEFVVDRHQELQREGLNSRQIYAQIQREIPSWRFRASPLSIRQIRRRIHG